jgi:predicted TIM-barrel fold metal-dependent hydrolase
VRGTADLLRISFGRSLKNLEEISWEEFFAAFDRNDLVFVYEEAPEKRFAKFVREPKRSPEAARRSARRAS